MNSQETALEILNEEEDEDQLSRKAMHIARGISFSMALKSAIELGVLEIISEASNRGVDLSASQVAKEIPDDVRNPNAHVVLERMLCLLASFSVLKCKVKDNENNKRIFGSAPICKYFLPSSFGSAVLYNHDKVLFESWNHLNDAVLEGATPFQKAHGMTLFEYMGTDMRVNNYFNDFMSKSTTFFMKKILDVYGGFKGISTLVDVGGGVGAALYCITSKYPHIKGVNFDLPHVIADNSIANPGVEHVGGDMFDKIPSGDAIFMRRILHDWSDEDCVKILRNCWKALPSKGKVIVLELLLPLVPQNTRESQLSFQEDLTMLAHVGGKERTKEEFFALSMEAGFSTCRIICSIYNHFILEFLKTDPYCISFYMLDVGHNKLLTSKVRRKFYEIIHVGEKKRTK